MGEGGRGKGKERSSFSGNGSSSSVNDRVYPSTDPTHTGNDISSSSDQGEPDQDESEGPSSIFINNDQDEEGYEPLRRTFIGLRSRRMSAGGEGGRRVTSAVEKLGGFRSLSPALSMASTRSISSTGSKVRSGNTRNRIVIRSRTGKHFGEVQSDMHSNGVKEETTTDAQLTMDSLTSTFNPFSSFDFRWQQLPETVLLLIGLSIGIYRLYSITPTTMYPSIPPLPVYSLLLLLPFVPLITLFRSPTQYYKLPFTDQRAYRDPSRADDGIAVAIVSPILLAIACFWDVYANDLSRPGGIGLEGIETLGRIWDAEERMVGFGMKEVGRVVLLARWQLFVITVSNTLVLLLHLLLAKTVLRIEKLPLSNMKRFFGFAALSIGVSCSLFLSLKFWERNFGSSFPSLLIARTDTCE